MQKRIFPLLAIALFLITEPLYAAGVDHLFQGLPLAQQQTYATLENNSNVYQEAIGDAILGYYEAKMTGNIKAARRNAGIINHYYGILQYAQVGNVYPFYGRLDGLKTEARQILGIPKEADETDAESILKIHRVNFKDHLLEAVIQAHEAKIKGKRNKEKLWNRIIQSYRKYLNDEAYYQEVMHAVENAQEFEAGLHLLAQHNNPDITRRHEDEVAEKGKAAGSFFRPSDPNILAEQRGAPIQAERNEIAFLTDLTRNSEHFTQGIMLTLNNPELLGLPEGTLVTALRMPISGDGACFMYGTGERSRRELLDDLKAAMNDPRDGKRYKLMMTEWFFHLFKEAVSLSAVPGLYHDYRGHLFYPYVNDLITADHGPSLRLSTEFVAAAAKSLEFPPVLHSERDMLKKPSLTHLM